MSQARNRWLLSIVLILGAFAFIGSLIFPLFESAFTERQPSAVATPEVSQTIMAQKSKLLDQAKGYEIVLQQEPNNQAALQGMAQARIELGDLQGAIAPLEKLVTLEPDQIKYHLVLGQVYAAQQKYDAAIAAFDRAIQTNQKDYHPVWAKALLLKQMGKTDQAKPLFEQAATLAPTAEKDRINQSAVQGAGVAGGAGGAGEAVKRAGEAGEAVKRAGEAGGAGEAGEAGEAVKRAGEAGEAGGAGGENK